MTSMADEIHSLKTVISMLRAKVEVTMPEMQAEIDHLKSLSVTSILIDVVPGWDGNGQEVYAKSVADVEDLLARLSEKAENYDLEVVPVSKAAERYEWIRRSGDSEIYIHNQPGVDNCVQYGGEYLDAVIDTAIETEKQSANL